MSTPNAYKVVLDENRTIMGRECVEHKDGVLFRIVNGSCVTQLALTHEAMNAMMCIAVKIRKIQKQKYGNQSRRKADK